MTVSITGYGGVNEIGGSKLLLEDGDRRVFFDFGLPFGRYGDYFDGVFIKERASRGLLDLLALGILPPLRGLLREDLIPGLDPASLAVTVTPASGRQKKDRENVTLQPEAIAAFWRFWQQRYAGIYRDLRRDGAPAVDAVLLSHAHQDHISDCMYLADDITAASTRMTAFIAKVLADSGMAGQGAPYSNTYELRGNGALGTDSDGSYRGRPWVFLDGEPDGEPDGEQGSEPDGDLLGAAAAFWSNAAAARKKLHVQSGLLPPRLNLRHWPLDHSIYGATGYAVETSAGWVAYTGDLRMHGRHGGRVHAFAEALRALPPVALLCEGTRLDATFSTTEEQAHDACLAEVRAAAGELVIADFAARNVERLEAFIDIAAHTGRRLLVQPRDAYLLRAMRLASPDDVPDWMAHASVALYDDPKASTYPWERIVRERYGDGIVNHMAVCRDPGAYILALSLTDMADLVDIHMLLGATGGGLYLFSNSPAFDDEQRADLARLWRWTRLLGLRLVGLSGREERDASGDVRVVVEPQRGYHASGHADGAALADFVRTVQPKTLIAIHTEKPHLWADLLRRTDIEIVIPKMAQPIAVG